MNLSKAGGSLGIIVALIVFSIIILFHEFGHFLLAKKTASVLRNLPLVWGRSCSVLNGARQFMR